MFAFDYAYVPSYVTAFWLLLSDEAGKPLLHYLKVYQESTEVHSASWQICIQAVSFHVLIV